VSGSEEKPPVEGGGEGGAPGKRAEPARESGPAPGRADDVREVEIGRPVSPDEYRRLKKRAEAPAQEQPEETDEGSNSGEEG
jgi:hypothetical protein